MLAVADAVIDAFCKHFPGQRPYRNVRLPNLENPKAILPVTAVFTSDGTRPRWDNLGVVVHRIDPGSNDSIERWRRRFTEFPLRAALIVANDNRNLLLRRGDTDDVELHALPANDRFEPELDRYAARFAPRYLAHRRRGQLSFVDLEMTLSPNALGFATRHRIQLHDALHEAIHAAIKAVPQPRRKALGKTVIDLALAYLAARVLEDKGFLAEHDAGSTLVNDPRELLQLTQEKTNGFFRSAYQEKLPVVEGVPGLLEALAAHLGPATTFALVSHHDVGLLYEWLLEELRSGAFNDNIGNERKGRVRADHIPSELASLQQHYTPIALTEQILEHLPLERIRPEHRYIFDPTAGSGSFLLAATQRLSAMSDLGEDRRAYLARHVVGNDIDPFAKDIAFLRYCLVQQSEVDEEVFPRPETFTQERYESLTRESLGFKPAVLVANPPYAQTGGVQEAAMFVKKMLNWLEDGAQFGLVLPTSFLTQSQRGVMDARKLLSECGQILEVWQCPPGVVGLSARQHTCVILGIVGAPKESCTIARAVISTGESQSVREEGLLGNSWIASASDSEGNWSSANMPPVRFEKSTIKLDSRFHLFTGPTPAPGETRNMTTKPETDEAHQYFTIGWKGKDRIWADPRTRPKAACINKWKRKADKNATFLSKPKLLVHNSNSRDRYNPLQFCFDDQGYWPDHNTHCIVAREKLSTTDLPQWRRLAIHERLLWLAGIFASNIGREVFATLSGSRHSTIDTLTQYPLPLQVDPRIIDVMVRVLREEQQSDPDAESVDAPLVAHLHTLDELVQQSYGPMDLVKVARTSPDPAIEQLRNVRREKGMSVVGQVVDVDPAGHRILLYLGGTRDEVREQWVPLPYELPGWALDGTSFAARMPRRIETFAALASDRAALQNFRHPPRAYEDIEVLVNRLSPTERS